MDKDIAIKLTKLSDIQEVDIHLSDIIKLRGTLPDEVDALQQDIEKLCVKMQETKDLLATLQGDIISKKELIKTTEKKVQRYETQQMDVRNNREYDAITKELELSKLDIQLAEKFLRTAYDKIEKEQIYLEEISRFLKTKESDLVLKKQDLETILEASKAEEDALYKKREEVKNALGEALYVAYERIRSNVPNNLAVVSVKKGACSGCCIVIPPQQKLVVHERNKIVFCEHCGRMLIAPEDAVDASSYLR
ncbi:zinc ribbon domain-containing protein [Cardinium endosymbiont of Tipula unca]|uniref:zinc ribbon domain-containing protein n=1 Tax=Cardinium endosymbiont of Tipula unca TaxID=3066216 RepID=UPI0030CBE352